MRGRFDDCCPLCEKQLDMHGIFTSHDYQNDFVFECPECGEKIEATVHSVPEFELEKAETREEYLKRRQEMIEDYKRATDK